MGLTLLWLPGEHGSTCLTASMLPLLKRHEIRVLRRAGHSQAEVSRLTGVAVRTIRRIEAEIFEGEDDAGERKRRRIGRPSRAEPFRELVRRELAERPDQTSHAILRRARLAGYEGSRSTLYGLVASLRAEAPSPESRSPFAPGEVSEHDYRSIDVRFADGAQQRRTLLFSRLGHSRWVQASLLRDARIEVLVRGLIDQFARMGGVPRIATFGRDDAIVLRAEADATLREWHPAFAQAMLDLGVGVEVTRHRDRGRRDALARLILAAKRAIFERTRFVDEDEARASLAAWNIEVNATLGPGGAGVTPERRLAAERACLRPLNVAPDDFALRIPVVVGSAADVFYEGARYAMHADSVHSLGTLYLYQTRVRILAGRYSAEHERA